MDENKTLIEEQFESQNKKTFKQKADFNEKNYLNLQLKPGENKKEVRIRILPFRNDEEYFQGFDNFKAFFVIYAHSLKVSKEISKSGYKSFICHNDANIKDNYDGCPLCEKSKEFYAKANKSAIDAEKKALASEGSRFKAKKMYIVRVIERGHEDEGVKFWRFNAHVGGDGFFDRLAELYTIRNAESVKATGERYNIFDLKKGRDIIISLKYDEEKQKTVVSASSITDAGFPTPLADSDEQIMAWVNDEKLWSDMYATKSNEYLEIIANGGIPVFNTEKNRWVDKNKKDDEDGEAEKEKEEEVVTTEDVEKDLPF